MPPKKVKRGGQRENAGRKVDSTGEYSKARTPEERRRILNIDSRTVFTKKDCWVKACGLVASELNANINQCIKACMLPSDSGHFKNSLKQVI